MVRVIYLNLIRLYNYRSAVAAAAAAVSAAPAASGALTLPGPCSMAVVDIVQTTLGPRGMDKMIYDDNGAESAFPILRHGVFVLTPSLQAKLPFLMMARRSWANWISFTRPHEHW